MADRRPLSALVAEFSSLRQEIGRRSDAQQTLINLNIVVVGTIVGFATRGSGSPLLLLILPLASSALGLLWLDHATSIRLLAGYIKQDLRYQREGREIKLFLWEEVSGEKVREQRWWTRFEIVPALIFVMPPSLALVFLVALGHVDLGRDLTTIAWWTGVAMTSYMLAIMLVTQLKPFPRRRRAHATKLDSSPVVVQRS